MENIQTYLITPKQSSSYTKLLCVSLPYIDQIDDWSKPRPNKQLIGRLKLVMKDNQTFDVVAF